MTDLLLHMSVKDLSNPKSKQTRAAVGRLSGIIGILCNLLLFAGKLLVGTLASSVSITADAMNNLSDATSSIVTLIGFRLSEKPADEEQDRLLRAYRDEVATRLGLFLPKHHEYKFHISLAYTRILPEGEDEARMLAMIERMDRYIADRPAFDVTDPYMAYYDDMLCFSPTRVARD